MQQRRRALGRQLLQNRVIIQLIAVIDIHRLADVFAHAEAVCALFHYVGGLPNRALVVVGRERIWCKRNRQRFALIRFEQPRFGKADQRRRRLGDSSLRRVDIRLQNVFARAQTRVRDRRAQRDFSRSVHAAAHIAQRKRRVAQAVTERIADGGRRAGDRFKVAIADEHILLILHIQPGFREIRRRRIGRKRRRERIRQMAGGADVSNQNIRRRQAALHAALPRQQRRADGGVIPKPEGIHHAAGVEHHRHARERRQHLFDHMLFLKGEEIIAVVRLTRSVVILTGEAADGEDGGIRKRARLLHEFVAQNGFARFARRRTRGKLRADVFGIKPLQRLKNLDLAFPLLDAKPLSQRTDVSDRRIAASAAALDIILLRFSKHRHARAMLQRERFVFVFEQHHALRRRSAGKRDVCFAAGDARAVRAQRRSGHESDSLPFRFHVNLPPFPSRFFSIIAHIPRILQFADGLGHRLSSLK